MIPLQGLTEKQSRAILWTLVFSFKQPKGWKDLTPEQRIILQYQALCVYLIVVCIALTLLIAHLTQPAFNAWAYSLLNMSPL